MDDDRPIFRAALRGELYHRNPITESVQAKRKALHREVAHGRLAKFFGQQFCRCDRHLQRSFPGQARPFLIFLERLFIAWLAIDQCLVRLPLEIFDQVFSVHCGLRHFAPVEKQQLVVRLLGIRKFLLQRVRHVGQQPLVEKTVDRLARGLVVVVHVIVQHVVDVLCRPKRAVGRADARPLKFHRGLGPVAGRGDEHLRSRRHGGGNFHVGKLDAQPRRILAKATALHGVGHHHARRLRREPVVDQTQHERLCAAAGTSGAGQPRVVNFRQCLEKIQRTNAVPCLQTHQVDPPELAHQIVGVRAVVTGLLGVIVAEHVVGECHHAALGKVNAPRRHTAFLAIDQPPLRPVAVRVENRRHFAVGLQLGPVKIAVEVIARVSLDRNIFHRVIAAINPAGDHRIERRALRHRVEAQRHLGLQPNGCRPGLPRPTAGHVGKGPLGVQCLRSAVTGVLRWQNLSMGLLRLAKRQAKDTYRKQ